MLVSREGFRTVALFALGALIAQYVVLFYAMTTAHITLVACMPGNTGGFNDAWKGWSNGVCTTEEIVWCDKHPGQHPDCETAHCRAEEVRMSLRDGELSDYDGEPVYACQDLDRLQQWVTATRARPEDLRTACVPKGDKRSFYLPQCSAETAAEMSEFYIERPTRSVRYPASDWVLPS